MLNDFNCYLSLHQLLLLLLLFKLLFIPITLFLLLLLPFQLLFITHLLLLLVFVKLYWSCVVSIVSMSLHGIERNAVSISLYDLCIWRDWQLQLTMWLWLTCKSSSQALISIRFQHTAVEWADQDNSGIRLTYACCSISAQDLEIFLTKTDKQTRTTTDYAYIPCKWQPMQRYRNLK